MTMSMTKILNFEDERYKSYLKSRSLSASFLRNATNSSGDFFFFFVPGLGILKSLRFLADHSDIYGFGSSKSSLHFNADQFDGKLICLRFRYKV